MGIVDSGLLSIWQWQIYAVARCLGNCKWIKGSNCSWLNKSRNMSGLFLLLYFNNDLISIKKVFLLNLKFYLDQSIYAIYYLEWMSLISKYSFILWSLEWPLLLPIHESKSVLLLAFSNMGIIDAQIKPGLLVIRMYTNLHLCICMICSLNFSAFPSQSA